MTAGARIIPLRGRGTVEPRLLPNDTLRAIRQRVLEGVPDRVMMNDLDRKIRIEVKGLTALVHQLDDDRAGLLGCVDSYDERTKKCFDAIEHVLVTLKHHEGSDAVGWVKPLREKTETLLRQAQAR